TRVVAVAIPVVPHGDAVHCTAPTLVEQSTGREWREMRSELGLPYDPAEPTSCVLPEEGEPALPYELVVPFIVPDDAEGPFWVDIEPFEAIPEFVRFSVDP